MKYFLSICFFVLLIDLEGQNYFNNRIDINHSHEYVSTNILKDSAGYLIFGASEDTAFYTYKFSVVKISHSGTVLFKKEIPNPSYLPSIGYCTKTILSGANNYLCASTKNETSGFYSIVIYKLNKILDTIFIKRYTNAQVIPSNVIYTEKNDQKGIFIYGTEYVSFVNRPFLVKTDSMGNVLWKKNYPSLDFPNPNFITSTSNGGVIIGYTSIGSGSNPPVDTVITRLDSSGSVLWSLSNISLKTIQTKNDGYLTLVGTSSPTTPLKNPKIIKLDSSRNTKWHKEYVLPYFSVFTNVIELPDSSYLLSGYRTNPVSTLYEGIIAKIGKNGDSLWFETITYNSTLNCKITDMQTDTLGGFILSGNVDTSQTNTTKADFWIIGIDSNGCSTSACSGAGVQQMNEKKQALNIYPTPSNSFITIQSTEKLGKIYIYNSMGEVIWSGISTNNDYRVDVSSFLNGIYLITFDRSHSPGSKKIIVQH